MSINLMTAAFKADLATTQKFVLVALCDSANDQGECYPSVQTIAEKCSLSDRAVQIAMQELETGGYLRREFRRGRSTTYWLTPERRSPPNHVHPEPRSPAPERRSPPPPNHVHHTPERRSPITVIEPSIEPLLNRQRAKSVEVVSLPDVEQSVLDDFRAQRKAKLTATAVKGLRREAEKAGISLQEAIETCCASGWQGFKAAWIRDRGGGKQAAVEDRNKALLDELFKRGNL